MSAEASTAAGTDTQTRTERAVRGAVQSGRKRSRWRRRPARRTMVLVHRWTSLVLGLLLVVETTSGALVLYHAEYFRATHGSFYRHTDSAHPISPQRAVELVHRAHPDFTVGFVSRDGGILAVGDPAYSHAYAVDPGSGRINGAADLTSGPMNFLVNLHDCAFTCVASSGYVPALAHHVPTLGIGWLHEVSWGSVILAVLGLLMVLLAVTGIITWWPGLRRLSHGVRVRTNKGRFARDYDLHNVLGLVLVPFALMWGVTGAAFEFPGVADAWLTITGGHPLDRTAYTFTARPAPPHAASIELDRAVAAAQQHFPGRLGYVGVPQTGVPYYSVSLRGSKAISRYRAFYNGETTVYVDAHDAGHVKVVDPDQGPAANRFYSEAFESSHFGWMVNGWWRIIWFTFGMLPLALMITGLSTWLYRRQTRRRRRAAASA